LLYQSDLTNYKKITITFKQRENLTAVGKFA
jgi:hypothetical protein